MPGIGAETLLKRLGHGDVHRDDRDAAVDIGLLGERAGDVERHVGGRCDDVVRDELGALPVRRMEPGKPAAGSSLTSPLAADRAAVRRRPCEAVDSDRVAVRRPTPADRGELEPGLIVAESAAAQAGPNLAPAASRSFRATEARPPATRSVTARDRKRGVGEAGVELAVDLHVERAVGRKGAEPVRRTALPAPALTATSSDVRPPPSRPEPATSSAGRAGVARLRRAHALQTQAPVAGRIARRSADRRLAVGDAGQAEAGRDEIERRERQRRRPRLQAERRAGDGRRATGGRRRRANARSLMSRPSLP